jgi:hypothetical protein
MAGIIVLVVFVVDSSSITLEMGLLLLTLRTDISCVTGYVSPVVCVMRSHIDSPFRIEGLRISSIPFLSGVLKL